MNLRLDYLNLRDFDEPGLRRLDQWARNLIQTLTAQTRELRTIELNPTTDLPVKLSSAFANPEYVAMLRAYSTTAARRSYLSPCQVEWRTNGYEVEILAIPDLPNDVFSIILEIRGVL